MLINRDTAEGIAMGVITIVLRRWDIARAKPGGTQRTPAGTIRIDTVTEYPDNHRVTAARARAAGYPDAPSAQAELDRRPARHTYAIEVSYLGPDERPGLAADDRLSDSDVDAIRTRLHRWDAAALGAPWTREYLQLIAANEAVRAPDLAARLGLDTLRFIQTSRTPAQGSRPDHQPGRRLPNFVPRPRISGPAGHDRPVTDLGKYGPWAVVAGGSEGVGAEFARLLAEGGLNLVLPARPDRWRTPQQRAAGKVSTSARRGGSGPSRGR